MTDLYPALVQTRWTNDQPRQHRHFYRISRQRALIPHVLSKCARNGRNISVSQVERTTTTTPLPFGCIMTRAVAHTARKELLPASGYGEPGKTKTSQFASMCHDQKKCFSNSSELRQPVLLIVSIPEIQCETINPRSTLRLLSLGGISFKQ